MNGVADYFDALDAHHFPAGGPGRPVSTVYRR